MWLGLLNLCGCRNFGGATRGGTPQRLPATHSRNPHKDLHALIPHLLPYLLVVWFLKHGYGLSFPDILRLFATFQVLLFHLSRFIALYLSHCTPTDNTWLRQYR